MQAPQSVRNVRIVVLGAGGVGKSMLVLRCVRRTFAEEYDPTIEDIFRKQVTLDGVHYLLEIFDTVNNDEYSVRWDSWLRDAQVFLHLTPVTGDWQRYEMEELQQQVQQVRRVKDLDDHQPLPSILVASKCDLPRKVPREELIQFAVKNRMQGYYETSARLGVNVDEVFHDAARLACRMLTPGEVSLARSELQKLSGLSGLLPWNWSKRAKWNGKLKQLEFSAATALAALTSARPPAEDAAAMKEAREFRFPEPELRRAPVAFYADIRQLLELKEGAALADVALTSDDGGEVAAHNEVLREMLKKCTSGKLRVEGLSTQTLKHLPSDLEPSQLTELADAGRALHLPDLVSASQAKVNARAVADSAAVERQMRPALTDPAIKSLSDVKFVVGGKRFRLHRAILWARSAWCRALLDEKWRAGRGGKRIEVTTMTPETFAVVVAFLYTGRAIITPELGLEVLTAADMLNLPRLVQLAEFALQPVIDAGNAVPLYLAAEAFGARQLSALCAYWMATELGASERHEQWGEVSEAARARVRAEHARLAAARAAKEEERRMLQQLPCLLAPLVGAPPPRPNAP